MLKNRWTIFTEAQIITAARERTGITATNASGSEYVSTPAIRAEIRENILECCKSFGASTSAKESDFVSVIAPTLSPPAAPSCTPSGSGGTLAASSYGYRITALYGIFETTMGLLGQATTTGSTGSVALTWPAVPNASGYKVYGRIAGLEQLLAAVSGLTWTDTGSAMPASGPPIQNSTGQWVQDYDINLFIGSDVLTIVNCVRSDAYRNETFLDPLGMIDPLTGMPTRRGGFVDQSLQQSAFEVMEAQQRWRDAQAFSWTMVNISGVRYLRLMPPPQVPINVRCSYISQAESISSLPDDARSAMENAACRAIIDCVLNRIKADPLANQEGPLERRAYIEAMQKQRDRYEDRYRACMNLGV